MENETKTFANELISVVVPIYKVEKFLRQCLDSIVVQTYANLEIILVDDGSPDGCPQICDEYVAKDSRVKVIHQKNGGYGVACNNGIAAATGAYIGLVESDDWIEPDMYEKLYNQIKKFDADVCTGSFYEYKADSLFSNSLHDRPYMETIENTDDDKLFSIFDHPFFFTTHQSLWVKLYKADLIKSIKFDEQTGASYQDAPFITELYCKTKKIIAVHDFLYHYRIDNENASSNNKQRGARLLTVLDQWQKAKNIVKSYGYYEQLKEEIYFHASKPGFRFYRNIHRRYKKQFFKKWVEFTRELRGDETFTFKYMDGTKKRFFNCILTDDFRGSLYDEYKAINFLSIPLAEKTRIGSITKKRILHVPVFREEKRGGITENKFLKIFKTVLEPDCTKYYFCGLPVRKKRFPKQQNFGFDQYFESVRIASIALQEHRYLKKYQNIYKEKEVVIVACGPTAEYLPYDANKIYIGVNRSFKNPNIKLDYLFCQDQFPEGMVEADNYKGNDCQKFYGILSNWHGRRFEHCRRIPWSSIEKTKANIYYLESIVCHNWAFDISIEPFGEFKSTVFSALQFALYTNPKRIYLVGCDCTGGYFYNARDSHAYPHLIKPWLQAKKYMSNVFPETEIVSVNPVGLKGFFKDVYTQSYIAAHPEIQKNEVKIL